jgi:hypothetical protein
LEQGPSGIEAAGLLNEKTSPRVVGWLFLQEERVREQTDQGLSKMFAKGDWLSRQLFICLVSINILVIFPLSQRFLLVSKVQIFVPEILQNLPL